MDKALKMKWLRALRSGKFEQGEACLKDRDGRYCCLGVLATIQGAEWTDDLRPVLNGRMVGHRLGFKEFLDPKISGGVHFNTQKLLAEMNDGERDGMDGRKTFKELADYISKNL